MKNPRLATLISLMTESSQLKQVNENFGNLAPLIQKIGPVLAVPFTRQTGVLRSIGQNSTYESPEKINYSNLRKMIAGEIKLKGGEPLAGIVVHLGGVPVVSVAWAKYKASYHSDYKVLYNYDEQALFDLLNGPDRLAVGAEISSGALDVMSKLFNTTMKLNLPSQMVYVDRQTRKVFKIFTGKPNLKGWEAFVKLDQLPKVIGDYVQNFVKLHSELAEELNGQKLTFSIIGIGVDQNMKSLQKDRSSAMAGVVPLPADKNYKDYIKRLSTQFAQKLNQFKVDKLTPSLKSLPVQDFKDPEKLAALIKASKLFDQELVQIGEYRYKLRKLETGGPGWDRDRDEKIPNGTVISKLEFEYGVIDSDEEKIRELKYAARQKAKEAPITDEEAERMYENIPPTRFQGEVIIYINLLNLSDTRIKVTKLTNHNW